MGHCFYSLYGLILEVRWEGQRCQDELEQFMGPLPFSETTSASNSAHIQLKVAETDVPIGVSFFPTESLSCYGLSIFSSDEAVHLTDGSSLFQIRSQASIGSVTLHRSFKQKFALAKSNFFLMGLIHLLAPRGLFDLHGAGLVRNGEGYLLLGESGGGKTSLAMSLVHLGWQYLSDDSLLLRSSGNAVEVLSFRKEFYLDLALVQHYPHLTPHLKKPFKGGNCKCFVNLERVYPDQFRPTGFPRVLIFNDIVSQHESTLIPLDRTSALIKLMQQSSSLLFNRQTAKVHLDLLKQLVVQSKSYQFLMGRDLHAEPGKIFQFFSDL